MANIALKTGLLGIAAVLLMSCSSAPKRTITAQVSKPVKSEQQVSDYTPGYYIEQASNAYTRTGDIRLRNQWLLRAADSFSNNGECHQSEKIIALAIPELVDDIQTTHARLIQAECLLATPEPDYLALDELIASMTVTAGFEKRIQGLNALNLRYQQKWLEAAEATYLSDMEQGQKSQTIWQLVQNLSQQQLKDAQNSSRILQPWLQLALIAREHGLDPQSLSAAVQNWQSRNSYHPLSQSLPQSVLQGMVTVPHNSEKVAVLLPFTGRLANQSKALKEGILAAYLYKMQRDSMAGADHQSMGQIEFFDTTLLSAQELSEKTAEFDFIIGPLMKDKINELLPLLPQDKPILALNRVNTIDELQSNPNQYFFSLAPEDEAEQLVDKVISHGAKKPVLVAADTATTKRMAEAFTQKWQEKNGKSEAPPAVSFFNSTKTLRSGITELLDVAQSKARIKQIENLVSKELHAVPRNRRDIDAIIVFANPEQTELLNPIIESSLSPFNDKKVPVFATSRSYSLDLNKNSLRDLRDLTFSDMPWMLPQHRWQRLEKETQRLWPERTDALRRLFAMGFDGFNLLPNLQHLRTLPYLSVKGLTGELKLTANGEITRKLPYGYVDNDEVTLVAMD